MFEHLSAVKDTLATIQSLVTVIGILAGGYWFFKTRQKWPRAKLSHKVEVFDLSTDQRLVRVSVFIENPGLVMLSLEKGWTWIQSIEPGPEIKEPAEHVNDGETEIPWDRIKNRTVQFEKREIEPGENDEIHFDFLLDSKPELIQIYSYLKNKAKRIKVKHWSQEVKEIGWNLTSIYDMRTNKALDLTGISLNQAPPKEAKAQKTFVPQAPTRTTESQMQRPAPHPVQTTERQQNEQPTQTDR